MSNSSWEIGSLVRVGLVMELSSSMTCCYRYRLHLGQHLGLITLTVHSYPHFFPGHLIFIGVLFIPILYHNIHNKSMAYFFTI